MAPIDAFIRHAMTLPLPALKDALGSARETVQKLEAATERKQAALDRARRMQEFRKRQRGIADMLAQYLYEGMPLHRALVAVEQQTGQDREQVLAYLPIARKRIDALNRHNRDRFIMQQMRQGRTNAEIMAATGLSKSQVQRIISRNRKS
jgi:hypothetical protein